LAREKAEQRGYNWYEPNIKAYEATLRAHELPDRIEDVIDSILQEIIECASCKKAYRIIVEEFSFLKQYHLPLPRLCPNCRHRRRLSFRNPPKFYHRQCKCAGSVSENSVYQNTASHFHGSPHCPNEFKTSYAPERPEIVYCEQCYQAEVV